MPGLEAQLRITAKDEAGTALDLVKKQIAGLDKSIATFDKMAAAVGKIAPATDPLIKSIAGATKALTEQRAAVTELGEGLRGMESSSSAAAIGQERLAEVTAATTRVMVVQGAEAVRVSEQIQRAQQRQVAHAREAQRGLSGMGGLAPFVAPALAYGGVKALEAGASLEQLKFRLRAVSGGDSTEAPFAEGLAAEIAAKYPAITQAKALDTYLELRGNAANQNGTINQGTARRNLTTVAQAQTAALALGIEITPEDAQNLLKAVEGSGRAGDPTAVGKMFDAYIRAKQVFGTAIDSSQDSRLRAERQRGEFRDRRRTVLLAEPRSHDRGQRLPPRQRNRPDPANSGRGACDKTDGSMACRYGPRKRIYSAGRGDCDD